MQPIKLVDLFAGPGGLGEGFSAFRDGDEHPFSIAVSAEKDKHAHSTLRLRAYWRLLKRHGMAMDTLYSYYRGEIPRPWSRDTRDLWETACAEALQIELGKPEDNARLHESIARQISESAPWVLIGGPPCQAYSVVGRVRAGAKNKNDPRHYLYQEYLRVIKQFRPAVFVMENVRGMLSSLLDNRPTIHRILEDLSNPGDHPQGRNYGYSIHSLVADAHYESGMDVSKLDVRQFIVRCEQYGIPQARHRVILVGIREDIKCTLPKLAPAVPVTVEEAIGDMPKLRSGISRQKDSLESWQTCVARAYADLAYHARLKRNPELADALEAVEDKIGDDSLQRGAVWLAGKYEQMPARATPLHEWLRDDSLGGWLNHETRTHMAEDLRRYAYAATYACVNGRNPVGPKEFNLPGLAPNHANWESGAFTDRFKVQLDARPAATVTSHIAKDGHAFIHPDPTQCRSLTVREAARLQTFPDNYYFEGPRTAQYTQVGNAVPPLLARQIAQCVRQVLRDAHLL